jgi:branched-chain amino acid transport system substrate-binding protein
MMAGQFRIPLMAAALAVGLGGGAYAQDIPIAMNGPMTGDNAAVGAQMKDGAEMAVADLNAAGGVLGRKLKLEVGDDACDPKQAVAVANQMVSKKVVFVAGHYCSGSSIPASKVYGEEGIIQISPASTNPKYTDEGGPHTFRVCGRDDQQGAVAGAYLADKFKGKKVAFAHDKSAYGKGLADETLKAYKAKGGKEVAYEAYTAGEKDYSALVTKLKRDGADVLYLGGYYTEAGIIVRQMHEAGMKTVLMSGDSLATKTFWSITGEAGAGTLMTFPPDPRKNAAAKAVVDRFTAKKIDPEGYTLYTYGAVQAWAQAVKKAGSTDMKKVSDALKANKADTVLGQIGFDKKGDVTAPGYVIYTWKNGNYASN